MDAELNRQLSIQRDNHDTIARLLEPHLLLIKSRTLNALYYDLWYHRGLYDCMII